MSDNVLDENKDANNLKEVSKPGAVLSNCKWLNYIPIGLSVWFYYYPHPFYLLYFVVLSLPIIGILRHGAGIKSNTTTEFSLEKGSGLGFILPPIIVMFLWKNVDYEIDKLTSLAIPAIGILIVVLVVLLITYKFSGSRKAFGIFLLLILAVYSLGASYGLNCIGDSSKPIAADFARVSGKHKQEGRYKHYILTLEGQPETRGNNMDVSRGLYNSIVIGDTIGKYHKKGLLGVPWTCIAKKDVPFDFALGSITMGDVFEQ